MRKVILIHGRDQQNKNETELKQLWTDSIKSGFHQMNLELPPDVSFVFPYFGDLLIHTIDEILRPVDAEEVAPRGDYLSEAEERFAEDFLTDLAENAGANVYDLIEAEDNSVRERGIENSPIVLALTRALDGCSLFGDRPLKYLTHDVYHYLKTSSVRKTIDSFMQTFLTDEVVAVIGHSLGSVIAYNTLRDENCPRNINTLITLGSPLGLNSIKTNLQLPLSHPKAVTGEWYNAYDPSDIVALRPLDDTHFPIIPAIFNDGTVVNTAENHHGIVDYLKHPEVIKRLNSCLVRTRTMAKKRD